MREVDERRRLVCSESAQQQTLNAPSTKLLPHYHSVYYPDPTERAG